MTNDKPTKALAPSLGSVVGKWAAVVVLIWIASGAEAETPARSQPEFDVVPLVKAGRRLHDDCKMQGQNHLDALVRAQDSAAEADREAVRQAETEYLFLVAPELETLGLELEKFEDMYLEAPARVAAKVPLHRLAALCRAAIAPQGLAGIRNLEAALRNSSEILRDLAGLEASRPGAGAAAKGDEEERPTEVALTPEEYRKKKAAWENLQREQEALQEEREKAYVETLQERLDRSSAPPPEAKVSIRKDLAEAPAPAPVEPPLAKPMKDWHKLYFEGIKPMKAGLSQMMTLKDGSSVYTRRQNCRLLYTATEKLIQGSLLAAPDPAVREAGEAMARLVFDAANSCLTGQDKAAAEHLKNAEKDLGRFAAALQVYGLTP